MKYSCIIFSLSLSGCAGLSSTIRNTPFKNLSYQQASRYINSFKVAWFLYKTDYLSVRLPSISGKSRKNRPAPAI